MFKSILKGDIIICAVVFLGSIILFLETGKFEGLEAYGKLGPAYWPRFLLFCMMALSAIIVVETIQKVRKGILKAGPRVRFDSGTLRLCLAVFLIILYLSLMNIVGFLMLTPFLMMAFMYLLGERSKGWIFSISFGMTIVIMLVFTKAMYVPLPRGIGLFLSISHLFY